jgi:hypothetical protein
MLDGDFTAGAGCGFFPAKIKTDSLEPPKAVLFPSRLEGHVAVMKLLGAYFRSVARV